MSLNRRPCFVAGHGLSRVLPYAAWPGGVGKRRRAPLPQVYAGQPQSMLQPSLPWGSRRTFATAISRCSRQLPAPRPCWRLCLDRRELRLGELTETATAPLQLFECTHFDDTTMVEHEDACRVADGGEPVGDRKS